MSFRSVLIKFSFIKVLESDYRRPSAWCVGPCLVGCGSLSASRCHPVHVLPSWCLWPVALSNPWADVDAWTCGLWWALTCDVGVWRVAPPISVAAHNAATWLGCSGCWWRLWTTWLVLVLLLTWTHMLLILLWCCLNKCVSACGVLVRLRGIIWLYYRVGLVGRLRIINRITVPRHTLSLCTFIFIMTSADDWSSRAVDDRYCMHTLWDPSVNTCDDITWPGVVVLETTIVPDVVGLHAFDDRAPVFRVLPGDFGNTVRVLVPDARAEPREFHDILIENLSGMKPCHIRPASKGELTALRRR